MRFEKLFFWALTVVLLLAFAVLYAHGLVIQAQSFGYGLLFVLPAVMALGLSIVTTAMALMAPSQGRHLLA